MTIGNVLKFNFVLMKNYTIYYVLCSLNNSRNNVAEST